MSASISILKKRLNHKREKDDKILVISAFPSRVSADNVRKR